MSITSRDTSEEASRVQRAVWARMGPNGKLRLALQMSDDLRRIAIEGEMARCPGLSATEAKHIVIRRMLGDELFEAAYGGR